MPNYELLAWNDTYLLNQYLLFMGGFWQIICRQMEEVENYWACVPAVDKDEET